MIGPEGLRLRKWKCTFACFQPEEVGRIAGLSEGVEAQWAESGQMPWRGREPETVSAVPVVGLAIDYEFSSRGWEVDQSLFKGGAGVANVFFYALLAADGACEVAGSPELVNRFRVDFMRDAKLAASLTCENKRDRYLYRSGDQGGFQYGNDLQAIIDRSATSPLCLIDLQGVATRLCDRARRPLLNIEVIYEEPYSAERVKWLSQSRV